MIFRAIFLSLFIWKFREKNKFIESCKITCKPINFFKNISSLHQDNFLITFSYWGSLMTYFLSDYSKKIVNKNNQ